MIDKKILDMAFDQRFPKKYKNKLTNSHVAIAGLGGLGSNIATQLARSGVGNMLLVDFDVVEPTNLNRQAYSISHLGMKKTDAIKSIINDINPYLSISTLDIKINPENASRIFSNYPIVCEAFDLPEEKAMLINTLLNQCPDTIIISGNGMAGIGNSNDIKTEKKLSRLYICGDNRSDISNGIGLMAPRVSLCASHQSNKVLQIILGIDK